MKTSQITYVVPTLNSARTLDATLLSLTQQEVVQVNVIVVDSGSTDGTKEICDRWGVKMLYCAPGNMYAAINRGLASCQTPWMAYLNSDDILYGDAVIRLINRGEQTGASLVYGNCDYIDLYGRFMYAFKPAPPGWLQSIQRVSGNSGFAQQSCIFRKQMYEALGGFDTRYRLSADLDFYMRALHHGARFSCLRGAPVSGFRLHRSQFSQVNIGEAAAETDSIINTHPQRVGWHDRMLCALWKANNLSNYLVRVIRQSSLEERIALHRSMYGGDHLVEEAERQKVP